MKVCREDEGIRLEAGPGTTSHRVRVYKRGGRNERWGEKPTKDRRVSSENNDARVYGVWRSLTHVRETKWNEEHQAGYKSLLGHDQRSCEHTPKASSFLVVMLTRVVALALETLRNGLLTLLILLGFTSRFPVVTAAE